MQLDRALEVEPCDICGDVGYHELIVTCTECNINREHAYCMRTYITEVPDDWLCETCQPKNGTTLPCTVNRDSNLQASKRQRKPGKTMFLDEDEVKKLSSGIPTGGRSTFMMSKKAFKSAPSKNPSRTSPMVHGKLPRNGTQKNQTTNKHASHSLSVGSAKEPKYLSLEQVGSILDKKIKTLDLQIEKPTKEAPCEALSARKYLPNGGSGNIFGSVAEGGKSNTEKREIQSIQEYFNRHQKFLPSLTAAWTGRFEILRADASSELYDGFEAHPPCVVSRKAYKLSTEMPSVLQLEPLPLLNILTDVFQNDPPTLQDIALYFFPLDNTERSRKNLHRVFKFMNAKQLLLRTSIDGVELLVFTSNQLDMDSKATAGYFLWGVFRKVKIREAVEIKSDMEPVDMDVDMIGGNDVVGRTDLVQEKPRDPMVKLEIPPGFENTFKKFSL